MQRTDPDLDLEPGIGVVLTLTEVHIANYVRDILFHLGEDPTREGLSATPERVARMYARELFSGYKVDIPSLFTHFDSDGYDSLVLERSIPFYSLCEHHLIPFFGEAHVGYLPDGRIVGLSKLARVVEAFALRPQTQERMTTQIADTLMEHLTPKGVMVVLEARHLCMEMRGVRKPGATTVTSAIRGVFNDPGEGTREEFLRLLGRSTG